MCGRYSLISDIRDLQQRFDLVETPGEQHSSRYNIAPTENVLTVRAGDGGNRAEHMRWGMIPSWAKNAQFGARAINARAETVAEKPAFRTALRRRRCLIPADGFYEWMRIGKSKQPMRIIMKTGQPFAFAGLWETWKDPGGVVVHSCAIITTEANDVLSPIHDRMPVILLPENEAVWLDESNTDPKTIAHVLKPYPPEQMEAYPVSTLVNLAANDTMDVIVRIQ